MAAAGNLRRKFKNTGNKLFLRYPQKIFTDGTDFLQIDMMDYVPVAKATGTEKIFRQVPVAEFVGPPDQSMKKSDDGNNFLIDTGRTRTKYKSYVSNPNERFRKNTNKEPLGSVLLPIPSDIQDGNVVNYTDDTMNTLVGAGLGGAEGLMKSLGSLAATGDFGKMPGAALEQLKGTLEGTGLTIGNAQSLATKYLAAQAISIFGGNVSLDQLLAREGGQIFNPNMELLFNGPSLRNFNFTFKMTPRSADEAQEVKQIIRFFKRGMAPKAGSGGLFLQTPNVFELTYRKGIDNHPFLNRFKQCFLTNINTNYTGEGVYSTYEDGTPVSIIMTLSFKELAPIYDIDYDSYTTGEGDERKDFKSPGGVGY